MASLSSANSSSRSPKKYDVFISFRGEDTRFNFTSHLHDALQKSQLDTYIDYRLKKGDEVWPSLESAIEDSTLFLVIFSENYASSTWCLKELTKIFDCSKNQDYLVIPVFYRVDPSHVRNQSGSYQKAFEKHENKGINNNQLQIWREALTHAANIAGWTCSLDRNEAELIKEIMNCIVTKLGPKYQSEDYLKGLIGIHKRMAYVECLLDNGSNNVQFIAIWGMGGIGKTTLAEALFHKLRFDYEGFCFLANVREKSKKFGIDSLREKLILKLLQDRESSIGMHDAIYPYVMSRLGQKKVLIVLDDVDDVEQLKILAKRQEFGLGSKILITTRDKQTLGNEVDDIYVLEALNRDEAFDLISINAFGNDYVDPKIRKLAVQVTQYASGNPLALKVLGSFLHGKNHVAWESQLDKLQKLPCLKINDILKMSLEGLDCEEKNIFFDIACFFNYFDVEDVIKLLDACGYSTIIGLKTLEDKALLDIHDGSIYMHHLIKEMGRQTVREESLNDPKRRSRLWNSNEISKILKENMGSETIEGITLNLSEVEDMCLSAQAFCSMPNLKFLDFHKNFNVDEVGSKLQFPCGLEFLPDKLRLLRWEECPLKSLPATFKAEHLVKIIMPYSNLTKFWDGVQNLVNLCKIDLTGSHDLIELPDFSKAIHLAEVHLHYCFKLQSVHPSILSLHSLRRLGLMRCKSLTSLISNTHLKSLIDLNLERCSRLNKFSVTSENHEFELYLSSTLINDELCSSSGCLSKLDTLRLNDCKSVKSLPYKLSDLRNLRRLEANRCNKLAPNLRSIFDEVRALEVLALEDCSELFELPDNISFLSSLRELHLKGTNIETLPLSIKYLSRLQRLDLDGCKRLRSLPELPPSIFSMTTVSCLSLGTLDFLLTNESEEVKHIYDDYGRGQFALFNFLNCMKLDQQSIKAAMAKVVLGNHKGIYGTVYMQYPGKIVPKWFMYRTTQNVVTIDLNLIPQPWDDSFIFCVAFSKSTPGAYIFAAWFIDGEYACPAELLLRTDEFTLSDHVFLWSDRNSFGEVQRKIAEKKRDAQTNTYHPLLQIAFGVDISMAHYKEARKIKECGVCPTSALEYQNYIQQIQLQSLQPHPKSIAMEAASRKRKYHSLLR
ncbi:hypothetical protein QN277_016129 [Acacia crassicarpa]|uniref:TIR domain-containing protein n=1 Tax=Acacia crassicarpa TaxID=499986 RepID=A0AAE1MVZ8_9FABA|nr:hypothetical protein QN277_016129 [Acacia crassicarpa]